MPPQAWGKAHANEPILSASPVTAIVIACAYIGQAVVMRDLDLHVSVCTQLLSAALFLAQSYSQCNLAALLSGSIALFLLLQNILCTIYHFKVSLRSSFLRPFWRIGPQLVVSIISFAVYLATYLLTIENQEPSPTDDYSRRVALMVITVVTCLLSEGILYFLPCAPPTEWIGPYEVLVSTVFIPATLTCSSSIPLPRDLQCQCWFPGRQRRNSFLRWLTDWRPRTVVWTSGNPHTQLDEIDFLTQQICKTYSLPYFALNHLACNLSNARWSTSPCHQLSDRIPVVIYSHGLYGWRQCHHTACEQLASCGFFVIAVDHIPDSMAARELSADLQSLQQTAPFGFPVPPGVDGPAERVFYKEGMERRAADVIHVIDYLCSSSGDRIGALDKLDTSKIFLFGHSYGGGTMATVACRDRLSCVRGSVLLDSWMYPMPEDDRRQGAASPILALSASNWPYGPYQFPFREHLIENTIGRLATSTAATLTTQALVIDDTDHQNFCDVYMVAAWALLKKPGMLGTSHDPFLVARDAIDRIVVAYFSHLVATSGAGPSEGTGTTVTGGGSSGEARDAEHVAIEVDSEMPTVKLAAGGGGLDDVAASEDMRSLLNQLRGSALHRATSSIDRQLSSVPAKAEAVIDDRTYEFLLAHLKPQRMYQEKFDYSVFNKYK